jgi:hypothetical protein
MPAPLTVPAGAALDIAGCAALIDSCVRSQHFNAVDVPAACELLAHLCSLATDWGDLATAAAVASALLSLMKRAAGCIQAAGQAQGQAGQPAAGKVEAAARCFPAAVPTIMQSCMAKLADSLAATAAACASSGGDGGGSTAKQHQVRAGAALLAVLLARSLVMLADAQEAAAVAAGSSTAQLFAR